MPRSYPRRQKFRRRCERISGRICIRSHNKRSGIAARPSLNRALARPAVAGDGVNKPLVKLSIRTENERMILEAAEAVFAEHGFGGATTAAIAARAGVPKANLHYYFS